MGDAHPTTADTFYGNEWRTKVCSQRSEFEAFNEIYKQTPYKKHIELYETDDLEDIDEKIKQVGDIEGGLSQELIPNDMPLSHWWWWYPNEPQR